MWKPNCCRSKTVRNYEPNSVEFGMTLSGYEIHMGYTDGRDCARPMVDLDGRLDGAISKDGNVRGCYQHGLFTSDAYRKAFLKQLGFEVSDTSSYRGGIEEALDELAEAIEQIWMWMGCWGLRGRRAPTASATGLSRYLNQLRFNCCCAAP